MLPDHLPRLRIQGPNRSVSLVIRHIDIRNTADVPVPRRILWITLQIPALVLPYRQVKQAGEWIVRGRIPVRSPLHSWPDHIPFHRGGAVRQPHRTPLRINLFRPRLFGERFPQQELARFTVQNVVETSAMRPVDQLPGFPLPVAVHQHRNLHRVPVVGVMRHKLVMPFQLAGIHVEGDCGIGVQVVAFPNIGVPVRRRVSNAPNQQIELRIKGTRHPGRSAALFPGIRMGAGCWPCFMTFFSRARDGIEPPPPLTGLNVVGVQEAAHPVLAAGYTCDHYVLDDERRAGYRVPGLAVGYFHVPQHGTGLRIQGYQVGVHCPDEDTVPQHGHAAIHRIATHVVRRQAPLVMPVGSPRGRIKGEYVRRWFGNVHNAVHHNRCCFNSMAGGHLLDPGDFQVRYILAVDLVQ